jgi:integrase
MMRLNSRLGWQAEFREANVEGKHRNIRAVAGRWHYRFWVSGVEYTGSTGSAATERNVPRAMARAEALRSEVFQGHGLSKIQVIPFGRAAEAFLTWAEGEYRDHPATARRHKISLAALGEHFGTSPVCRITAGSVEQYKGWRRKEHNIKEITLRHDLHTLSKFLGWCRKHGWLKGNPMEEVEIPGGGESARFHVVSLEEQAQYFKICDRLGFQDLHDLALLMLLQGVRPEEVMAAQSEDLDWRFQRWSIPRGKSRAARRELSLTAQAIAILVDRATVRGPLFWPFNRHRQHSRVLKEMGGERFRIYDFRHTFASRLAAAGVDLVTIAKILGHANLRSVQCYCHSDAGQVAAAMARYEKTLGPEQQPAQMVQ